MVAKERILKGSDVKEQMWLTNVKHLWLSLDTSWPLVFCIDRHVCTRSKVVGIS